MKSPDTLKRIFEPFPPDGMTRFKAGDKVRLARSYFLWQEIPVGTIGTVLSVGQNEIMNQKGRPYEVRFHSEDHLAITTPVGPNDLEPLVKP